MVLYAMATKRGKFKYSKKEPKGLEEFGYLVIPDDSRKDIEYKKPKPVSKRFIGETSRFR